MISATPRWSRLLRIVALQSLIITSSPFSTDVRP